MRIITEDNVDQLLNLSYQSKNINKLLHLDNERDIKYVIEQYKQQIDTKKQEEKPLIPVEPIEPRDLNYSPEESSQIIPSENQQQEQQKESPQYVPLESPPYAPGSLESPPYAPGSLESPPYAPGSLESPPYAPGSTNGLESPPYALTGGQALIFQDSFLNETFNKLSGDMQGKILQLPEDQRVVVMKEIIKKSMKKEERENPLHGAFNALPIDKQIVALKGGYTEMAKEFNTLSKKVHEPIITYKPNNNITDKLNEQYPILAVNKQEVTNDTNDNHETEVKDESDDGTNLTKKISF